MEGLATLSDMRAGLEGWRSFILARCRVLQRYPGPLFQEAINEPEATAPAQAAARAFAAGEEKRPFIRWLNKPQATVRCLATLTGHENSVDVCALSPDGFGLVSGSWDGTVRFWDLRTSRELATYPGRILAVAPRGGTILTQSPDHTIRLFDIATRQELKAVRGPHDSVSAAGFSPDGQRAVLGFEDGSLAVWEPASGQERLTLPGQGRSLSVCAFSLDGSRILSRTSEGPWEFWDADNGGLLGEWPCEEVQDAWSFSPDGSFFVCGSGSDALAIGDVRSGRERASLGHDRYSGVLACAISPDSSCVATANMYGELKVWDAQTAREIATLLPERATRTYQDCSFSVDACAFSPDGSRIVSLCSNGYLVLWDATSGSQVATLERPFEGVGLGLFFGFSPDGGAVLCPRSYRTDVLRFWDVSTGRPLGSLAGHRDQVRCCAFSPDRARIVTGSGDGTLRVWDAATATGLGRQAGHSGKVTACVFSPDGTRVLSGAEDGTLKLWDAESGRERVTIDVKSHVDIGRGDRIYYNEDDSGRIRSSYSPDELRELIAGIKRCVFSPDGSQIVSESATGTRNVWDASTGRALQAELAGTGEPELSAPDRVFRPGCPWQKGLTLERPPRRRRLSGGTDAEAIAAREVWVAEAGTEVARFPDAVGEVTQCDVSPIDCRFAVGDDLGFVYILVIEDTPGASARQQSR